MDEAGVERALLAAMQKGPFIEIFKDLVKVAVAEATAAKVQRSRSSRLNSPRSKPS